MRLTGRQTARTAFFWLLVSPLTPAAADELGDSIAAVNRAMVGSWAGRIHTVDSEGEARTREDAFTFSVTTDDGTGYAFWRAGSLTLSDYQGDGVYLQRSWDQDGQLTEASVSTSEVAPPDADGRWSLVETQAALDPNGNELEQRTRYTFGDGVLASFGEERPAGTEDQFVLTSSGEWTLSR